MKDVAGDQNPKSDRRRIDPDLQSAGLDRQVRVPVAGMLVLRSLQWTDLPQLEALTARCGESDQSWAMRTMSRSLTRWPNADDRAIIGIAEVDGGTSADNRSGSGLPARAGAPQLFGIAAMAPDLGRSGDADVSVLIDPQFRDLGLGARLLGAIVQLAAARGYASATARVAPDNTAFRLIAARLGFTRQHTVGAEPFLLRRRLAGSTESVPAGRASRLPMPVPPAG
jgi:ribosomal protein S18 acetylase RimI-like enzyme